MAVTRADVAKRAGVSPALVSYVLNPGSRPVSAAARARIEAAIAELGYRPNAIAQALRRSSSRAVALLVPNFTNPVITTLASEIEARVRAGGYVMLTGCTGSSPERETDYVHTFISRNVDAIIIISTSSKTALTTAAAAGTPVLVLDSVGTDLGVSSLTIDATGGAAQAVRHLIEVHGHTRIACIASHYPPHSQVEDRVRGWRTAMQDAGLPASEELVVRAKSYDYAGGRQAMETVLDTTDATAVFVTSDMKAAGALSALRHRGLQLPTDFAVVSFDGTMLSEVTWPRLTTVNQFLGEVASTAMQRIAGQIANRGSATTHDVLRSELIIRESCGCDAT